MLHVELNKTTYKTIISVEFNSLSIFQLSGMMIVRLPSVNVTVLQPGVLERTRTIRLTKIIQKANVSKKG